MFFVMDLDEVIRSREVAQNREAPGLPKNVTSGFWVLVFIISGF